MSDTETYSLSWNAFKNHLQLILRELYEEEKNSDLTLITDDQTQFKAHKFVISAGSSVLKRILESNLTQHPVIYLRGIESYEIDSILQFVYLGEANVSSERLEEFLRVSADLGVKEISEALGEKTGFTRDTAPEELDINRDPYRNVSSATGDDTTSTTEISEFSQNSLEIEGSTKVSEDLEVERSEEMQDAKYSYSVKT